MKTKKPYKRAIDVTMSRLVFGKLYSDNSFLECFELYHDENLMFQIRFLYGGDCAYTFLPECDELMTIMREGVVGLSMENIADMLINDCGYYRL